MPEKQIVISKGKAGEEKCSVCDKVLKENKVIPKLEHINMKIIFAKTVEELIMPS